MKKIMLGLLAALLLISMPFTAQAASNLSTDQKYEVLKQNKIFTGFADGKPHLAEPMSREQLAVVLVRLLELPDGSKKPSFDDVLKIRWSFKQIEAVKQAKLMSGTAVRKFSPEENVTVEQMATVFTRSYGLTGSGTTRVTGKVSEWARAAVSLALDRKLIPQLNDYTVNASRALLVEAAYAVFQDTNVEPLRVKSVEPLSNQVLKVNLLQAVNNVDKSSFVLKDVYGNNKTIQQVSLNQDGMSVLLWTDRQQGGIVHTLSVDGSSWSYVSIQDDTTKPTITSFVSYPNRTIEVTFSESVEKSTATNVSNYQINNSLKVTSIQLSSDQRKVVLTTSEPTDGRTYQMTIRNVKDLAGNVMDTRSDFYFTGSNDSVKPKVNSVQVNANATLTVKFSEKIKPEYAVQPNYYTIDKGLAVIQATLESDGQTVTLRTSAQKDATVYNLTISGIPDLAGNVMDVSTNWMFGGIANPEVANTLQGLQAINFNTIEAAFSRSLSDADVANLKLTVLTDNGSNVSWSNLKMFVMRKAGDDKAVTVQIRNTESNPNLFRAGHVYSAQVSGVSSLSTANGADRAFFAGTDSANLLPAVTQASVIDRKSVKLSFNEPVTNVTSGAFRMRERGGDWVTIDGLDNVDANKIVTECVLKLRDELKSGKTYEILFQGSVTDAAKFNGLKTTEGSQPYVVSFNA